MRLDELPTNEDFSDYDWAEVFRGDGSYSHSYSGTYSVHDGGKVDDVTAERIARVYAWFATNPDGYASTDFACLVELTDGTWAACMAWCDTTGWDCRSDVQWKWARTRDEAISQGLDRAARERLGLALPSDGES